MTPRLRGLMDAYPAPSIEFVVMDQFGDMIEERLDVALHVGQPPDSSLLVHRIGAFGGVSAAAPTIWSSAARRRDQPIWRIMTRASGSRGWMPSDGGLRPSFHLAGLPHPSPPIAGHPKDTEARL